MIKIEREIKAKTVVKEAQVIHREHQASLNSDGCITLRAYNHNDRENDEIIILSQAETRAIFKLMNKLKIIESNQIPF